MCIPKSIFILYNMGESLKFERLRLWLGKQHNLGPFFKCRVTQYLDTHQSHVRVVERKIYSVPELLKQRR